MRGLEWIDPDGGVLSLNIGDGVVAAPGVQIAGMPPVRAIEDPVPLTSGSRWRHVDYAPREVSIPVSILGSDSADLETFVDDVLRAFDPTRGDGRLRVTRSDGGVRELTCRYIGALAFNEAHAALDAWRSVLVLRAVDPFYSDPFDSSVSVATDDTPTFFPFFPLRLGESEVSAAFSITNTGHTEAWPVWTLTGPLSDIVVRNATTGESFEVTDDLAAGETIEIDTRPGRKVITTGSGEEVFPITGDSTLWSLAVGLNSIEMIYADATADSEITVRWRNRWLSA